MKLQFVTSQPKKTEALVIFVHEGGRLGANGAALDKKAGGYLRAMLKALDHKGKAGEIASALDKAGHHVVLAGLGKPADTMEFEKAGSALFAKLVALKAASASIIVESEKKPGPDIVAAHLALGMRLNSYRFDKYRTKPEKNGKPNLGQVSFVLARAAAAKKAYAPLEKIVQGVFWTRDLVSEPGNVLYPASFAARIKKEFTKLPVRVTVLDEAQMKKLGMFSLLSVGQGSAQKSRLVVMQYNGAKKTAKPLALVGKGVTFDTGGISIKPAAGMDEMKWDMGGAGAVVGAMRALAARKAKVNIVAVVGLAENMPSGTATRPGDVVKSMSGQTIEILNTDAEGRRVLADALWYVQEKFKPQIVLDLATLTGAIITALGHEYAGVFSNDDALPEKLAAAGRDCGEPVWHMPLCEAYDKEIDSSIADMKDINRSSGAGSAIGGVFLQRFIKKGTKWAHLDIAGMAWTNKSKPCVPAGATAFGVRLLERFIFNNYEK